VGRTVADAIRELTKEHLEQRNGLLLGQCLSAVGWVQNTVPPHAPGLVELPMSDVSGPGVAVGAAIMGRRPILVLRFQSFLWLAASPIVNYAAKARELWGYPAPLLVRAIAAEGGGTGPVHSGAYHSPFMHMPGLPVCAPMTPGEVDEVWTRWLTNDDPLFVSEHRRSYQNTDEMPDEQERGAEVTIVAVSAARFAAVEAVRRLRAEGIRCNLVHVVWLKPFDVGPRVLGPLTASRAGLVVDSAYEVAGASRSIAYELMLASGRPVHALGVPDHSPGVARRLEHGTPTAEGIVEAVRGLRRSLERLPAVA
jgi:pyruvate dehydrogenase E1 component beta subunit